MLKRGHQRAEVAVARENDDVIKGIGQAHGINREFDVHVAFDLAAASGIGELFGRLGHHREAVVVQPIDQRADRRIFLLLGKRRVIERSNQLTLLAKHCQKPLVIDVKAERFSCGIEVGAVNKQGNPLCRVEMHLTT